MLSKVKIEETCLEIHTASTTIFVHKVLLQEATKHQRFLDEHVLHHVVEVLSIEDLCWHFSHLRPLLVFIRWSHPVLDYKNATAQKDLEVVEKRIKRSIWLGVLVELIFQNMTHNLWISGQQSVWAWEPGKAQILWNRLPATNINTPILDTVDVGSQVFNPPCWGIMALAQGGRHVLQNFNHMGRATPTHKEAIEDLHSTEHTIGKDAVDHKLLRDALLGIIHACPFARYEFTTTTASQIWSLKFLNYRVNHGNPTTILNLIIPTHPHQNLDSVQFLWNWQGQIH